MSILPLPENQGELAGRNWREQGFQTKDFDCLLDQYRVHEDGTLWRQTYAVETTRKGWPSRQHVGWEPMSASTGTVRFYDSINGQMVDYWVEWAAVFVTGKVTEVKLERWEERDNRDRLACEAKWKLENEKRERFLATWIGRRVYPSCAWVAHGCLGCQSTTSAIGLETSATALAVGLIEWATSLLRTAIQSAGKSVAERGRARSTTMIDAECQPDKRTWPRC